MEHTHNKIRIQEIWRICRNNSIGATTKMEAIAHILNASGYGRRNLRLSQNNYALLCKLQIAEMKLNKLQQSPEDTCTPSEFMLDLAATDVEQFDKEQKEAFLRRRQAERDWEGFP